MWRDTWNFPDKKDPLLIISSVTMYEALLTTKSLSNLETFCWSTQWLEPFAKSAWTFVINMRSGQVGIETPSHTWQVVILLFFFIYNYDFLSEFWIFHNCSTRYHLIIFFILSLKTCQTIAFFLFVVKIGYRSFKSIFWNSSTLHCDIAIRAATNDYILIID